MKTVKKKSKTQHPLSRILFLLTIIAIIVLLGFSFWFTLGERWYYSTPHLTQRLQALTELVDEDNQRIVSIDEKIQRALLLSSRSSNKDTVSQLLTAAKSDREAMQETLTALTLETIALEESRLPYDEHRRVLALTESEKKIKTWYQDSGTFFDLVVDYTDLLLLVVAYKENAAVLTVETLKTTEASAAHAAIVSQIDAILVRLNELHIKDPARKLDNLTLYFQKVKLYHEKSKAFYDADIRQDLVTEKALAAELDTLESELSSIEFMPELSTWQSVIEKQQRQLFSPFVH